MKYAIQIAIFFRRTAGTNTAEPDLTPSQVTRFMRKDLRYKKFVTETIGEGLGVVLRNIKYAHNIISFTVTLDPTNITHEYLLTAQDVKNYLLRESLEDGVYEGLPGNCAIVPSSRDARVELGVIDYRIAENIRVEAITPGRRSSPRRSPPRDMPVRPGMTYPEFFKATYKRFKEQAQAEGMTSQQASAHARTRVSGAWRVYKPPRGNAPRR